MKWTPDLIIALVLIVSWVFGSQSRLLRILWEAGLSSELQEAIEERLKQLISKGGK